MNFARHVSCPIHSRSERPISAKHPLLSRAFSEFMKYLRRFSKDWRRFLYKQCRHNTLESRTALFSPRAKSTFSSRRILKSHIKWHRYASYNIFRNARNRKTFYLSAERPHVVRDRHFSCNYRTLWGKDGLSSTNGFMKLQRYIYCRNCLSYWIMKLCTQFFEGGQMFRKCSLLWTQAFS